MRHCLLAHRMRCANVRGGCMINLSFRYNVPYAYLCYRENRFGRIRTASVCHADRQTTMLAMLVNAPRSSTEEWATHGVRLSVIHLKTNSLGTPNVRARNSEESSNAVLVASAPADLSCTNPVAACWHVYERRADNPSPTAKGWPRHPPLCNPRTLPHSIRVG